MANSSARFISTDVGLRASQACDRCRIKKTRCDGGNPCSKCAAVGFLCTVSDKLARRSFPKGYTVNLENKIKDLEKEIRLLKSQAGSNTAKLENSSLETSSDLTTHGTTLASFETASTEEPSSVIVKNKNQLIQINNPIDQIFNLDENGIIIGNDNLNFESQFNHLLINLKLPFLKITNSHNYLQDDPNTYLFHRSYSNYNNYHNKDLSVVYNPLTIKGLLRGSSPGSDELPTDVYDLFIKLVSNFKKLFRSKKELDQQIVQFFLNYNTFIPIFEYEVFMQGYDAFHTMYPFMFTYDDATINGFNLSSNDYQIVNEYLVLVIQIYAMILMNDPSLNLNLLLNHKSPKYSFQHGRMEKKILVSSLYDFLPYLNIFHVSVNQLHTYLLFLYYSLITNNKEKSLVLSSLINAFIGILGVNLNCDNLFFSDLSLSLSQRRDRVKVFWSFKILLKCFNLKFGFKPTINTTVINPVTIDRYFKLTPEKLSLLISPDSNGKLDGLFETLLAPSVEFLNLMNIVIPSSFSPNYYEYLKQDRHGEAQPPSAATKKGHASHLDWILNDDDGDGNDGNLNYNYNQFLSIDKNLSNWRYALQDKRLSTTPFEKDIGLTLTSTPKDTSLYCRISFDGGNIYQNFGISQEGLHHYVNTGLPDVHSAIQLIKMQLHFHYLMIRSMNYLNFVIEHELASGYYLKIASISREVLAFFLIIFQHVGHAYPEAPDVLDNYSGIKRGMYDPIPSEFGMEEEGLIVNDFSARRIKKSSGSKLRFPNKVVPTSPYNPILNGLSLTMINFKKVIVLQMLYLLICNIKIAKKGGSMSQDTLQILNDSITLFIKIFVNYQPHSSNLLSINKKDEMLLFKRIIADELEDEILNDCNNDSDLEDEEAVEIDWDDENMDEDLKYLKILKYIQYKTRILANSGRKDSQIVSSQSKISEKMLGVDTTGNSELQQLAIASSNITLNAAGSSSFLVQFSPGAYAPDPSSTMLYPEVESSDTLAKFGGLHEAKADKDVRDRGLANDLVSMRNDVIRQS